MRPGELALDNGSRVAVIGGGPAGSLFAYFVRRLGEAVDLDIAVDVYEPRPFTHRGPAGCNHCGGIVSESLVQMLATEGINLPRTVVQRGIESYMLHMDVGDVRIETPGHEKRIAAVFRANGPRESEPTEFAGFDRHLLDLCAARGATVVRQLVTAVDGHDGRLRLATPDGPAGSYDLVAVAAGVNSRAPQFFGDVAPEFVAPGAMRTFICEFDLGEDAVKAALGDAMHVFLLDIPRLEFAALIPKGDFVTLALLGEDVDDALVERFLATPEVARCFPGSVVPRPACHCFPRINTVSAVRPYADRIVWIGDSGVNRLYKDGIGSAYRTAKAAARTAVFSGIAARDFAQTFWPECRTLIVDNSIAKVIFAVTTVIQKSAFIRRGVLRMTAAEQAGGAAERPMSSVLWDIFSGSAPYREILLRTLRPSFPATLAWSIVAGNVARGKAPERPTTRAAAPHKRRTSAMGTEGLGRIYGDRQVVVRQGEVGDCMYAIQQGKVEVVRETGDHGETRVAVLEEGDLFGEMAIFEQEVRSATVRALGEARVLTIDKRTFLRRVQQDPSLAFNVARMMCTRIRHLNDELAALQPEPAAGTPAVGAPVAAGTVTAASATGD